MSGILKWYKKNADDGRTFTKELVIGDNELAIKWEEEIKLHRGNILAVELIGDHIINNPGLNCASLRQGQTLEKKGVTS